MPPANRYLFIYLCYLFTYNPALPNIHDILRKKQPILQSTERLRNIFKEIPVVVFRRSPTLGARGFFSRASGSFVSSAETGNRAWKASGTSGTVHQTFVTYSFVRNSQTTTTHPNPLPAHSVATLDMAASPAHTLTMEKDHTLSPTQEKQDKLKITLLVTQQPNIYDPM